jgi:two-component system, OmpR family, phosphate regulon sensor histidine kinase PhoR
LIASNYAVKQEAIESDPKLNKYLSIIIEQSNKLNQHIERLLSVAKTESNLIALEKKEFDVVQALELVKADEFHFYNIAYNIVENAIKYGNGKPRVDINISDTDKGLELKFSDNGSGIPAEHIDYVFDRFYRVPRPDKKDIEGFGIGLFYVKKICDLHKWNISIHNNDGSGISIIIHIPKSSIV